MGQSNEANAPMLRFDGVLYENLHFEPLPGWETQRVAHRPASGDGEYQIELRDEKDQPMYEVSPRVDFEAGCASQSDPMRSVRVTAYLPTHPRARFLVFTRKEFVIYRRPISAKPPRIRIRAVKAVGRGRQQRRFRISWTASHPEGDALRYRVVYVTASGRGFPVSPMRGGKQQEMTVDLGSLPGGRGGRFGVLATDGVRSAVALSRRITVGDVPPQLLILSPSGESELPYGQPVQLCGRAFDGAGSALPEEDLIWELDGAELSRASRLALGVNLKPGRHRATLRCAPNGKTVAEQRLEFTVAKPNRIQSQFDALLPDLVEALEKHTVIHEMNDPVPGGRVSSSRCGCCDDGTAPTRPKGGGCGCR